MATAGTEKTSFDCVLCHDKCIGPRKLPECGHCCCETCILLHLSKLEAEGQAEIGFPCPSCEVINAGPKDVQAAIGWIQSLERGEEEVSTVNKENASDKEKCSPCKHQGKTTDATKICLDCDDALCQSCSFARHNHPLLRNHKVKDVQETGDVSELFQTMCKLILCDEHQSNHIKFYCNDHEEYGCEGCVDDRHKNCVDVVKANSLDAKHDYKTQTELIEGTAGAIRKHAKTYFDRTTVYVEATNLRVEEITDTLKSIRKKINLLLDIFEANTIKLAKSTAKEFVCTAENDKRLLNDMISTSELSMLLLGKINSLEYGNQHDMIIEKLKDRLKGYEEQLINISEMKENFIELKQSEVLTNFINVGDNATKELGAVTVVTKQSSSQVYQSKLLLRQRSVTKQKDISVAGWLKTYSYMSVLAKGDIVLTDETNSLSVKVNQNGRELGRLNLSEYSPKTDRKEVNNLLRAASKHDGIVAVPRLSEKKLLLVSADSDLKVMAEIKTLYHPKAVHVLRNGKIAVAWNNPAAFGIISVSDTTVENESYLKHDAVGRLFKSFDFMAVDEKRSHVIQPCTVDGAIYCFDFDGNPKFRYKQNNGRLSPRGAAHDADGNIYVCFSTDYGWPPIHQIHVLTPSGTILQTVSSNEGCPRFPVLIEFDRAGTTFVVTQGNGTDITLLKIQNTFGC